MARIGQKKRQESKMIFGCIKQEIKAGRRDGTIARLLDGVSMKEIIGTIRWMVERAPAKARRY